MKAIYSSPYRILLVLILLIGAGILSGLKLPISLYPNSTKPSISVWMNYGPLNSEEFMSLYGTRLESSLNTLANGPISVSKVISNYQRGGVNYRLEFDWGVDPKEALKEVQALMTGASARFPREIRDSVSVNYWSNASGFIAVSFFSPKRSVDELYRLLDPVFSPKLTSVQEAENPTLWNPAKQELLIELKPEIMASLGLFPRDIEQTLEQGLEGYIGGALQQGKASLQIQMPRQVRDLGSIRNLLVKLPEGGSIHLSDVAYVEKISAIESNQVFMTNSSKSIILFASPRSGANVKRMAEEIIRIIDENMIALPNDIEYRLIVDPSEFIRSSIYKVSREVVLAALIASLVLFLFIGSARNTLMAALEIPFAMVMALILMNLFEMNLNLISLGGLALAAGMNVDAAVVVMDNIFRHLSRVTRREDYLDAIVTAVNEVKLSIIASTVSTLVVFGPLMFTQDLTQAILGDLAKAVVFSHVFSLGIALFLVPTVRLWMIRKENGDFTPPRSPLHRQLETLMNFYRRSLRGLLGLSRGKQRLILAMPVLGIALALFILPSLPREIIGKPDTDWMVISINAQGNTMIGQMETIATEVEADVLEEFSDDVLYTFNQVQRANQATLMLRLKDKGEMERVWRELETKVQNTPELFFWIGPWNPAELPIPDFSDMRLVLRGGLLEDRTRVAEALLEKLNQTNFYGRLSSNPGLARQDQIVVEPHTERWPELQKEGVSFLPYDLLELSRVATQGKPLRPVFLDGEELQVRLRFPEDEVETFEQLQAIPLKVGDKLIPMGAVSEISLRHEPPNLYRENNSDVIYLEGSFKKNEERSQAELLEQTNLLVTDFLKQDLKTELGLSTLPVVYFDDAKKELTTALNQAAIALLASLFLIFLTLLFQFVSLPHTLIIFTAIPFAFCGGIFSLFVFQSTLSLNSALGVILLNGIAVNNSIILVDFIKGFAKSKLEVKEGIIEACSQRLRPILITSLTTILGMMPIALGTGDGGKILQPLGIVVTGGLWVSMIFTLYFVPLLEFLYLKNRERGEHLSQPEQAPAWTEEFLQ